MKKLLSVLGILALASALIPVQSHAGLRGSFDPLTNLSGFVNGAEQPSLRQGSYRVSATAGTTERFFAMTTRSGVAGSETVREMWLHDNTSQAGGVLAVFKWPLLVDPAAQISYADPAWSPDGKYLAYVQTNQLVTFADIYVQQFTISSTGATAAIPIGAPIHVVTNAPGQIARHPAWDPSGTMLVYDSNVAGSIDLYTIPVFPTLGTPTRITFNDLKSEQMPAWSPDGTKIAYATNQFGVFALKLLDLSTVPNPTDGDLAEPDFAPVTHLNPNWGHLAGVNELWYDAPGGEDVNSAAAIWKINLDTQQKCQIQLDARGASDPDVSPKTNHTPDGIAYNYYLFSSQAAAFGTVVWRGQDVTSCFAPLPMAVSLTPTTWNLGSGGSITATLTFPPETQAAGFWCQSVNNGTIEGVRMRTSILASPTMMGLRAAVAPGDDQSHPGSFKHCLVIGNFPHPCGAPFPDYEDKNVGGQPGIDVKWDRKTMTERLVSLGLVNQQVPVDVNAYSNVTGRGFRGFAIVSVSTGNLSGSAVRLLQNSPNPFNPVTQITFANSKPGNVELRIFNARGELVQTLAKQWFPMGEHTVTWDGRTTNGSSAPSGMYFAQVKSGDAIDHMKMMLMK